MLIRRQTPNLLQIFCKLLLYFQVIFKGMRVPDDTKGDSCQICLTDGYCWREEVTRDGAGNMPAEITTA